MFLTLLSSDNDYNLTRNTDLLSCVYNHRIDVHVSAIVVVGPAYTIGKVSMCGCVSVIYNICEDWDLDFVGMFACIGLWNSFFLLVYAFTDASNLMKWCTRSVSDAKLNSHFFRHY